MRHSPVGLEPLLVMTLPFMLCFLLIFLALALSTDVDKIPGEDSEGGVGKESGLGTQRAVWD